MLIYLVFKLLNLVEILLLVRVVISWLPIGHNRFTEILYTVTEPILAPIRNLLDSAMGNRAIMIDFSPIIAFMLIGLLKRLIVSWI
ncbi:MAG: YggT family protein [Firmicutes bacterium]|nr:YggT family protein [Bacillota bacterium]